MAEDEATAHVTYEELAQIEDEFEEIDLDIVRKQYDLSKSAYAKRAAAIAKIPNFWPLVFEQAPPEVDQFVQPSDSRILGEHLIGFDVSRPELDAGAAAGSPRSLRFRFEFSPNDYFEDAALEKTFHYRRAADGWAGLVSEPVRIRWKPDQDPTEGLTDAAVELFAARAGDATKRDLPAYDALKAKVEHLTGAGTSFFTWFGFVSGRRYVSPEESAAAVAAHEQRREARRAGKPVDRTPFDNGDADEDEDDSEVEVHEAGEELAVCMAEEVWPNAIRYFTQAQEMEDMSDVEFEEMDDEDEDDEDEGDEQVDVRALIAEEEASASGKKKRESDVGPPKKRSKQ